jgi:hypothetical protein
MSKDRLLPEDRVPPSQAIEPPPVAVVEPVAEGVLVVRVGRTRGPANAMPKA